jgi:hypothetical protein
MEHPVTEEMFLEWVHSSVTQKLFKALINEREEMKEGLVNDNYERPDLVKGRCQAIALILDIKYEELYNDPKRKSEESKRD